MSIIIKKVFKAIHKDKLLVEALHHNNALKVYLIEAKNIVNNHLNKEIIFEMDYEEIVSWKTIGDYFDEKSGLFNSEEDCILVRGMVHNIISTNDDAIIDIYIANGAEFITITSSDINNYIPRVGEGIELIVNALCIYPVHY